MLYFHWIPSLVHQAMYTDGAVDIHHVIQMMKYVIRLPVLALDGKINMFFLEKLRMELKCHRCDIMNIDDLSIFYTTNIYRYGTVLFVM